MVSTEPPRFILFLPPTPSPSSLSALRAAFGDTLSQVLKEVASHSPDSREAAILEVALACPDLAGKRRTARSALYASTQATLASVYKLICVVAAKDGINVEDADGVDVRIIPIAWSSGNMGVQQQLGPCGPIIDLETLARSGRQWQYAFGVESEAGEAMVKAFVAAKGTGEGVARVQSGPVMKTEGSRDVTATTSSTGQSNQMHSSMQRHYDVAVGGTFDHIHIGHKLLLTMTVFAVDEPPPSGTEPEVKERSATIGITGNELLKNKNHASVLQSWEERQLAVQTFLDSILNFTSQPPTARMREDPGPNGKSVDLQYPSGLVVKCTEIQDPFGPTITEEQISALIVSGETRSGGQAVNDKRTTKGWRELEVFEVVVLDAEDEGADVKEGFGSKLSSTAIREKLAKKTAEAKV